MPSGPISVHPGTAMSGATSRHIHRALSVAAQMPGSHVSSAAEKLGLIRVMPCLGNAPLPSSKSRGKTQKCAGTKLSGSLVIRVREGRVDLLGLQGGHLRGVLEVVAEERVPM